jgi:adenylate cyclase
MDEIKTAAKPPEVDPRSGLSHVAIREQLDRILTHREFHATDKMRDFLRFVVEEKLAGRASRLKGYTIATRVFARGDDFDASEDPVVRIQAGRLRRALERYYLVAGGRDPIFIDIPKGRYIPYFSAQNAAPERRRSRSSMDARKPPGSPTGPSVAVLPLVNLSDDPEQHFFTVGLVEDLATELSRFQDIVVISCHQESTAGVLSTNPVELGRIIGARFILQGTVRRDPQTVKVAMQLIDTATGKQVWADAYSHPVDASRLIETQERIAQSVVAAIASEFGIIARRLAAESRKKSPSDLRTYEAILLYYSHQIAPTPETAAACLDALRAASERESEYGPVWSALASLHCQMYTFDAPGCANPLDTALEYARRGVFLEPGSQLARMILAYASYLAEDSESFREESEIALALNPNSPYTVGAIGYFHAIQGDFDRGLALLDRAIAVCPCHPRWFHSGYVLRLILEQDYEGALSETTKHLPFIGYWDDVVQAAMLGKLGREDEASEHVERVAQEKPDFAPRARDLIGRALKIDPLIDDLIDGLRRARMEVEQET